VLADRLADFAIAEATVASAATVDLGAQNSRKIAINGTAAITSFGARAHSEKLLRFTGVCTLTHDTTALILPTGANIITAAGDTALATSDANGSWRIRHYQRSDGSPLRAPLSFRNRIINGNFAVNQRSAAATSNTFAAGAYILDRWKAGANGVTMSFATAVNGDVTVTITAGTLLQIIEGALYLPESGQYVLSWTGTATARVYQGAASGSYGASPLPAGPAAGTNTTIEFSTGTVGLVQFEPGAVATAFERRDNEMNRCRRYYRYGNFNILGSASAPSYYLSTVITFDPPMRAAPNTFANYTYYSNVSNCYTGATGTDGMIIYTLSAAAGNGQLVGFYTAEKEL
jgi:hypothetical protein